MAICAILTVAVASDLVLLLYNTFSMCPFLTGLFWVLVAGGICFCWCGSVSRFSVWGENMSFSQALWVVLFFQSCAFDVFYTGRHRHTCFISPLCLTVLGSALRSCLKPPQRPILLNVNCANEKRHRVFGVCARVVCSHTAVKAEKEMALMVRLPQTERWREVVCSGCTVSSLRLIAHWTLSHSLFNQLVTSSFSLTSICLESSSSITSLIC